MMDSILVGLESGDNFPIVQKYALEIGKYFQAEVHGIHVIDVRKLYSPFVEDVLFSAGLASVPNLQEMVRQRLDKICTLLKDEFEANIKDYGLKGDFESFEGVVSKELARQARSHDLLVIGTKGENFGIKDILLGSTFNEVIRTVNVPIVAVPKDCNKFFIRRVLIAYDGSEKSHKALRFIANSVKEHNLEIELITVRDGNLEEYKKVFEEGQEYLKRKEVKFQARLIQGQGEDVILSHAQASKCDLIAMGAHGGGLKDYFVGSLANQVLENTSLPVVLMN